jgi:hypothetical protein
MWLCKADTPYHHSDKTCNLSVESCIRIEYNCINALLCVQEVTGNRKGDLPGQYTLPGSSSSSLVVYGPRQWFTPCAWNEWHCSVSCCRFIELLQLIGDSCMVDDSFPSP